VSQSIKYKEEEKMARVQVINEVSKVFKEGDEDWSLCLQWCRYIYEKDLEHGYRFIWRRPNNSLQAARGQACIHSLDDAQELINKARKEGWGDYTGKLVRE
jgi:hypothetical protein